MKQLDALKSLEGLKSFNWRSLKKYTSPRAADDLNAFLEGLPQHGGKTMLIVAAVCWSAVGVIGLFTTVQMQKLTELRAQLQEASALQPIVPIVKDVPVDPKEVSEFVDKSSEIYKGLSIKGNGSSIMIAAPGTSSFGQFREAIGHVQNGGAGWSVSVESLCVGRECGKDALAATLKINKVSVEKPG